MRIEKPKNLSQRIKNKIRAGGQELTVDEQIVVLLYQGHSYKDIAAILVRNKPYGEVLRIARDFADKLGLRRIDFIDIWRVYKK